MVQAKGYGYLWSEAVSPAGKDGMVMANGLKNSGHRDSSSKIIFEDPILCAQFLRGYVDIPILKNVQPEDIEDVSERYIHMFVEERDSDVVKKVNLREEKTPFYLISLIEHKSGVDYNVVMQIFRYMAFIWEDYEKEMEKKQAGISRIKDFRYPPILPIVFYDGQEDWTAVTSLHERVLLSDVLGEYIPNYKCILMQLKDYSNAKLMEKKDELSVVMMITKLHQAADFVKIGEEVSPGYLEESFSGTPEYLLGTVAHVVELLLNEINVPAEESARLAGQIKERRMGRLFSNFEPYDVQETRRVAREEEKEEGIRKLVRIVRNLGVSQELTARQLAEQYELSEADALKKVKLYWE